jgi:effector-binding domain-containing protein
LGAESAASKDTSTRREPAHKEACVPQILSAYDAVAQWIGTQGRTVTGSPREVYFGDFDAAKPTDEVCDIAFPVS